MMFVKKGYTLAVFMVFLIAAFVLISPGVSLAHRLNVFAVEEGDMIHLKAKFAGGRYVKAGHVMVLDSKENVLHEGQTDDAGSYLFKRPAVGPLKIVVDAGQGHRGEWMLDEPESASAPGEERPTAQANLPVSGSEEIRKIVEESVERNIRPLKTMMLESMEKGFSLRDIMGGVGYIIGLVGLVAYFRARSLGSKGAGH
jgi:nickel transport protein